MKKIDATPKTIRELFTGAKYVVHYYQREYRWGARQVEELLEDLSSEFLESYDPGHPQTRVQQYGHYFLGSIVLSESDNAIIDGQQRLTTITLLLIYLYHELPDTEDKAEVLNLFYFRKAGTKSFSINDHEREACLTALKNGDDTYTPGQNAPESVRNIFDRYQDIKAAFPDDLKNHALVYFKDWLLDNVDLIRIVATTEQDAHKIFVSMNDRGLSLSSTEMLKGFLLSEIADDTQRNQANEVWKRTMLELNAYGEKQDADFLKTWLRAQYAETIRETRKGAENLDWDIIGNPFHKWVRDNKAKLGLGHSDDYYRLVTKEIVAFARAYGFILQVSRTFDPRYEHVFYNAHREFTLQHQLLLAAIDSLDDWATIEKKIRVVSCFIDQEVSIRVFNYKSVSYNTRKNAVFQLTKRIRRKPLDELATVLTDEITTSQFQLAAVDDFGLNQFTSRYMLHILARLTRYVEEQSGRQSRFEDYVSRTIANPYDIEHIWANHYQDHANEFQSPEEFDIFRNRLGGLLLLPRDINRSLQDKPYADKLRAYVSQNLLAWSLHTDCFNNNPQFRGFVQREGLLFTPVQDFTKANLLARQSLYRELCQRIWNPRKIRECAA